MVYGFARVRAVTRLSGRHKNAGERSKWLGGPG
jgi:hypothetical protein